MIVSLIAPQKVDHLQIEEFGEISTVIDTSTQFHPDGTPVNPHELSIDNLHPLAKRMSEIALTQSAFKQPKIIDLSVTSGIVAPGNVQRGSEENLALWHNDAIGMNDYALMTSTDLTTEYIAGEAELANKKMPRHVRKKGVLYILFLLNSYSDKDLEGLGLHIKQYEPGDVLRTNGTHIHRSTRNDTDQDVYRIFGRAIFRHEQI